MSVKVFIQKLQQRILKLRASVQQSQQGRLRVMSLEDRRLLDATAGFLAGQLMLDGFDAGQALAINEDVSGHLDFDLSTGQWGSVSGTGLSVINSGQTLRVDAANVGDLEQLDINSSHVALSGIDANAALNLSQLQIHNGGDVSLSDLQVSGNTTINATSISDSLNSEISVSGVASFEADSTTLGDHSGDTTNFGSLTFVSTGDVSIHEDSATQLTGTNSADSLTLTSNASITNASASILNVQADAVLSASSIELNEAAGSENHFGSVTFSAAGNVTIHEASDLQISADSSGANVELKVSGNIQSAATAELTANTLSLTTNESLVSEGGIGTSGQSLRFTADTITTESDGDQFLASSSETQFSTLTAVDSSTLFDGQNSATINLNEGEFTGEGAGITGGLIVSDHVELSTDAMISNVSLSSTSEITFRIESTATPGGAILGNFDQWQVSDSVSLAGAALTIADQNLLANGSVIRLIDNNGSAVSGTFAGLAEGATVTGTSGQRYQISYAAGSGNDVQLTALTSTFAFAETSESVSEDVVGGSETITINRTGDTSVSESVVVNIAGGTAVRGVDFGSASQLIAEFAAGATSASISIDITDDAIVEANESLNLTLVAPADGFVVSAASSATLTIVNDDVTTAQFQLAATTVAEGDSGISTVTYQVSSSAAVDGGFSIAVAADDLQAVNGTDYVLQTSSLSFTGSANEVLLVTVDITGETLFEGDESFDLQLGSVTAGNAGIDVGAAFTIGADLRVGITNDDTEGLAVIDSGRLIVSDQTIAGQNNSWSLSFDSATNEVVLTSDTANLGTGSAVAASELRFDAALITQEIILEGGAGDDVLTVDFTDGNPIVGSGLRFDGGSENAGGNGDGLSVIGDGILTATYTPDAANFGDGQVTVGGSQIQFVGLEPVDISGFATATLNLPGAADVLTIGDGTDFFAGGTEEALRVSGTSDGIAIETVAFFDNANLVIDTVASGSDGVDVITVSSAAGGHGNSNLTINTGSTAFDEIRVEGAVNVDGNFNLTTTTLSLNTASVAASGDQVLTADVLADQDIQLTGSTVRIVGSLDSSTGESNSVSVTGDAVFSGDLGTSDSLSTLSVSGMTSLNGNVTTTGQQSFANAVTLTSNAVLTSTASGSIQFLDTVDGAFGLTLNTSGDGQFVGIVGGTAALASLTTDATGTTTVSGGAVTTSSFQSFGDAVSLTTDTILNAATVSLLGGTSSGGNDLTINGNLNLQSNIAATADLNVAGSSTLNGDVVATGRQDYRDAVSLAGDSALTADAIRFFDTVDGNQLLTANASGSGIVFDDTIGGTTALSGLNTTASTVQFDSSIQVDDEGLAVASTSTTVFAGNVTTTNGGAVNLDNGGQLSLANGTTFQLDGAFQQAGLGVVVSGADVVTTGDAITFASALTQTAAIAFRSTASGNVAGADVEIKNVNSAGFDINLNAGTAGNLTVDSLSAGGQLTVEQSASTVFSGSVAASTISLSDTVGSVTFQNDVNATSLLTTAEGYSVRLLEDTAITNAVVFANSGLVTFGDSTNDVQTFDGGVTSVVASNLVQGTIQTSADNLVLGQTSLAAGTMLTTGAGAGDIVVGRISGSGISVVANSGSGTVDLSDAANVIGDLTITAAAATVFEADDVSQDAAWTVAGNLIVSAVGHDVVLSNSANRFGDLSLNADNVELSETGNTTIDSVVASNLVQLTSTGSVNDASSDSASDITAAAVTLTAESGVGNIAKLELDTVLVSIATSDSAIDVSNASTAATVVQNLTTASGQIDYVQTASGNVDFQNVANVAGQIHLGTSASGLTISGAVTASSGDVVLSAVGGDIDLAGTVSAESQVVTISSSAGILGDASNSDADVVADRLVLSAGDGIGAVSSLETTVNEVSITTTGAGISRVVNSGRLEVLNSVVADDVQLKTNTGDVVVAGSVQAAGQTVLLQSEVGRVIDSGTGAIVADVLGVSAATGIDLNSANNRVTSFAATTAAGDLRLIEADGFQVSRIGSTALFDGAVGVTTFGAGSIQLTAISGDLQINDVVDSATGDISISAAGGRLEITSGVSSDAGDLVLTGESIQQSSTVTTAAGGTLLAEATAGDVNMLSTAITTTDSGSITVQATNDVQLAALVSGSGNLNVRADSDSNSVGFIGDSNAAATNLTTTGVTSLTAATGIDVDTNLPEISAAVTSTGNISIAEVDALTLKSVTTADGSISVSANGRLIATSVVAAADASDSISLSTNSGGLVSTSVVGSGQVTLAAGTGNVEIESVVSTGAGIAVTASDGSVQLVNAVANQAGAVITVTASADILDAGTAGQNLSAVDGTVTLVAANIGTAGSNVFKPTTAAAISIDTDRLNLTATGADPEGVISVELASNTSIDTLVGNHVFVEGLADINLASANPVANSLSIIAAGNLVLPGTVTVADDLRLEGANVTSVPGPTIDLNATRILFVSASSADLSITASEFDGKTDGDLTVSSDSALLQLTDLNCDSTSIHTNGAIATLNQTTGGRIIQQLPADSNQNSRILSGSLLLTGTGTFEFTNTANNIANFAADVDGSVAYSDADTIAIATVDSVDGITTTNQDVLLHVAESIDLQQQVNAGTGDARVTVGAAGVSGSVIQGASGQITANELGIVNSAASGNVVLAAENDVNTFAATNAASGGNVVFQDVDEIVVGTVSALSIPDATFAAATGISANGGEITIAAGRPSVGSDSLRLDAQVVSTTGTVRILVDGNLNQNAAGVIQADQLSVRQIGGVGDVVLDDANSVNVLAIENLAASGAIGFQNQQSVTVGTVSAETVAANPNATALQFAETSGLTTNDGTIQLNVDGPAAADGAIQLDAEISSGTANIGITADGQIIQAANATITASDLLVRQQAEQAGLDVNLGAANNDVSNVAIRNQSEGGAIVLNDVTDLAVDTVTVVDVGDLSILSFGGIDSDAGDINVSSTGDLMVNQSINAASDTSTAAIDEMITLISRSGNFTLADGTVISTDENPAPGQFIDTTGDRITILAGTAGAAGTVDLGDPTTIELRTDGGVARQIAPRPSGFTTVPTTSAESAFVTLTDAASSRQNLTFTGEGFLGELDFIFGVAGEENLEVVVDWGVITLTDLTANGVAGDAVQQASGEFVFGEADRDKSIFLIDQGGERYQISHLYETGDLVTTPNDRNGRQFNPNIIGVRFSVAQHESINVFGTGAVDPTTSTVATASAFTGSVSAVTDAAGNSVSPLTSGLSLLTSTDTNGLRNLQAEASADFPLQNLAVTSTGQPIGLAEFEFIAGPPPGIVRFQPSERFIADYPEVIAPADRVVISDISGDAFFGDGAASDAGVGTDVYLQIRRYFELDAQAEVVIARITDSDLITSREAFEEFVAENSELQDGAGYEIWLVTETGGQQVERPVVQFEITGGRPGPATESLLDSSQPAELIDVEFEQADGVQQDQPSSENAGDGSDSERAARPGQKVPAVNLPTTSGEGVPDDGNKLQSFVQPSTDSIDQFQAVSAGDIGSGNVQILTVAQTVSNDDEISGDEKAIVEAGISESTAIAGVAAAAFGAVSRFRARHSAARSNHSMTSRTMKSLRSRSALSSCVVEEDQT
ncbi:MAG: Calx-beta domain-containing protein [Fuerstiella sp.]